MAIEQIRGRVIFLRVHERGTGYGPPHDNLNDAEVIVKIENNPRSFGFGLRPGDKLPAAQAMFALIQDAYNTNTPITIEYQERPGSNNHYLFRVIQTR
jgi:hypothetical protein